MTDLTPVPIDRTFSKVPRSAEASDEQEFLAFLGHNNFKTWAELDENYRTVILAEAGAGKTFEMESRARYAEQKGRIAFYIRVEDINDNFSHAFEVGDEDAFEGWLKSQSEAWFYLDSVDEARLENPRAFEKAIRIFSKRIQDAQLRARIYISSRPYSWRPQTDSALIKRLLPFLSPQLELPGENAIKGETQPESALRVYVMRPLNANDIRIYAQHRLVPRINRLMDELDRKNLMDLASRPFDLEAILAKWIAVESLGGRRELLTYSIQTRLKEFDQDRASRQSLPSEKAREGASLLAAAVVLSGESGITVPDNSGERAGLDAEAVLARWGGPKEVRALVEKALFNDVLYGAVRFRHREIREMLAAEWFAKLLQQGNSRHALEALFFRDQYGETVIPPRLRPILPWLILEDHEIRRRAIALQPEIAVEGGDPSELPFPERKNLLSRIVERIVAGHDDRSARDNSAIARIALPDLVDETISLLEMHHTNDEALFFLCRVVWQGEMSECVPSLLPIAATATRDIYVRVAAVRAIMTSGTHKQILALWDFLLTGDIRVPRILLRELISNSAADSTAVNYLLKSFDKLDPFEPNEAIGLTQTIHNFIDRFPSDTGEGATSPVVTLVDGLNRVLERPPHLERLECPVSADFAWILGAATHAVERLVESRMEDAMRESSLKIMLKMPAVRFWRGNEYDNYEGNLQSLVPAWTKLNDALFWESVKTVRAAQLTSTKKPVDDDWPVRFLGHYWAFDGTSFPRVTRWIRTRKLEDDKLVSLSLAFHIYLDADQPGEWLTKLRAVVSGNEELETRLHHLLNPPVSETSLKWRQEEDDRKKARKLREKELELARSKWVRTLREEPQLVRSPPNLEPGTFSRVHYLLLREIEGNGMRSSRADGAAWQSLVPEFGQDVAHAFRDAALDYWRQYEPKLKSEGADTGSIPYALIFGMVGLEIESREVDNFPDSLDENDVRHALRYIIWELNGFPGWFESIYRAYPQVVLEFIQLELDWELENTDPKTPMKYLLHKLAFFAPWIHKELVKPLLLWVERNPVLKSDLLLYVIRIIKSGGVDPMKLAAIAQARFSSSPSAEDASYWLAQWVDVEPDSGVSAVDAWLGRFSIELAEESAKLFITSLLGARSQGVEGSNIGNFRQSRYLKTLYVLMHRYIPTATDVHRVGKGSFSPDLRDDAQDARNTLFQLLSEIPGKDTYVALKQLIYEHPDPKYRPWMAKRAYKRAEEDGDLEPWSAGQISDFDAGQTRTPSSHRQLFELTADRLTDLKSWLERSNDSPYRTWQRAESEVEMRNLVAGWLNNNWGNRFTIAQEPELANNQRIDIWLHNHNVRSPVPVELKLLDQGWSGPKLCERLRNQLAGDYIREETAGCGVMLLISQGRNPERRWQIGSKRVKVEALGDALSNYWASISDSFPNVTALKIIVIDLTLRGAKSDK